MSEENKVEEKAAESKEAPKVAQPSANDVTRPRDGTKTGRVWEIADTLSEADNAPAKRKPVLDTAIAEGINPATAATQYGRWRKFHGLKGTGRDEAAKTEAKAEEKATESTE